jgi:hypothetical protein
MPESAQGYVYYQDGVSTEERDTLLQAYEQALAFVIHHSPNQICFDKWRPDVLLPQGQAFGKTVEIRWWPQGDDQWAVHLLSEAVQTRLTVNSWQLTEMDVDAELTRPFLWGNHWQSLKGAENKPELTGWTEAQIDAQLDYPVANGGRDFPSVRLSGYLYRQHGIVRLTRLVKAWAVEQARA